MSGIAWPVTVTGKRDNSDGTTTSARHNPLVPRALAFCLFEMDWYNVAALDAEGKDVTFGYVGSDGRAL